MMVHSKHKLCTKIRELLYLYCVYIYIYYIYVISPARTPLCLSWVPGPCRLSPHLFEMMMKPYDSLVSWAASSVGPCFKQVGASFRRLCKPQRSGLTALLTRDRGSHLQHHSTNSRTTAYNAQMITPIHYQAGSLASQASQL